MICRCLCAATDKRNDIALNSSGFVRQSSSSITPTSIDITQLHVGVMYNPNPDIVWNARPFKTWFDSSARPIQENGWRRGKVDAAAGNTAVACIGVFAFSSPR